MSEQGTDEREGDCVFSGAKPNGKGYVYVRRDGRLWRESRWVWTQAHGSIPDGHDVHHRCKNRACCELSHLELTRHDRHKPDHHAKLTPTQVREIRARYVKGPLFVRDGGNTRELMAQYGISKELLSQIMRRKRYAWVT